MSDKAQTTRNKIMGIYTTEEEQIVFIDTPGIHKPKTALGDFMVESAYSTLREVDTVLFMVPADEKRGKGDDMIMERLKQAKVPVILVVNKIDKVHPDQLLEQIDDFRQQMDFKEIVPISATQGTMLIVSWKFSRKIWMKVSSISQRTKSLTTQNVSWYLR